MGRNLPPAASPLPDRVAELLLERGEAGLAQALDLVVTELQLRSAVLRDVPEPGAPAPGRLRAVAGDAVHAVPTMRVVTSDSPSRSTVHVTVRANGRDAAVLTVVGGRPSQLPALRAVATVLGLALSRPLGVRAARDVDDLVEDLVRVADAEADATADLLHDGPVQALVVAHYAVEAAARRGDPALARETVQNALVELRRTLWHLRPRTAGTGGLPEALELLSNRLQEAGHAPVGFVVDELLAEELSPAALSTAYRVVQAVALANGADPVRVALRRDGAAVALDVEGGGPLPDPARWATKARALGGSLIEEDGRIRLVLPLPAAPVGVLAPSRPKATL